jgi:hypothetical protein
MSVASPLGRHAIPAWEALRSGPVSASELARLLNAPFQSVNDRLLSWERAGVIVRLPTKPRRFEMVDEHSSPPRIVRGGRALRAPTKRQRIWTAIRILKNFDLVELGMTSEQSRQSITAYLTCLCRAGYVKRVRPSTKGGMVAAYRLLVRSGSTAPKIENRRIDSRFVVTLVDPNDGSRHDISPGAVALRPFAARDVGGEG